MGSTPWNPSLPAPAEVERVGKIVLDAARAVYMELGQVCSGLYTKLQ
jgi:hypothetical protein